MDLVAIAVSFLLATCATPALAALARRRGWTDLVPASERERKPRRTPVPTVGGAAVLLAILALHFVWRDQAPPLGACFAAFLLGSIDDRRPGGLRPHVKLLGQGLVALVLGWELGARGLDWVVLGAWVVVGQNALNTFDNADGAASVTAALGLSARHPLCAAVLGFLPWNLRRARGSDGPWAYLGDAGSHLLGTLLALDPVGRLALVIPILDLGRLSVLRLRLGARPWQGDRRHLAHRLAASGLGPVGVAGVLGAMQLPVAAVALGLIGPQLAFGILLFAFACALVLTPPVDGAGNSLDVHQKLEIGS